MPATKHAPSRLASRRHGGEAGILPKRKNEKRRPAKGGVAGREFRGVNAAGDGFQGIGLSTFTL
jgi:hypothetical protein